MTHPRSPLAWGLGFTLTALAPTPLYAGGLDLTDRGTRALGQGYASVASPDDPDALWFNPAGLADAGRQFLGGASLLWMRADYRRIDGGGNEQPGVGLRAPPLPLPTVAYSDTLGSRDWTFGVGLFAPGSVLFAWPEEVVVDGTRRPAPQRYALYSLEGSALVHLIAGAAWRPSPRLSIGIAPLLVLGSFQSRVAVSACDGVVCAQPENPSYDGVAEVRKAPVIGPSLGAGIRWRTDDGAWRLGASVRLPVRLLGPATLRMRMPEAALFDGARLEGEAVDVSLGLPLVLRAGAQWRPSPRLRLDLALVYEHWASEDRIRIEPSEPIWVRDIRVIQEYQVGPIDIPRGMRPVVSARAGAQWAPRDPERLWIRAGLMAENGAFPDAYLTPMTLDSDKLLASLGASLRLGSTWWIDVAYGHLFLRNRNVRSSRVYQPSALRPPRSPDVPPSAGGAVPIGNGDYAMEADVFSVAVRWRPAPARSKRRRDDAASPPVETSPGAAPRRPVHTGADTEVEPKPVDGTGTRWWEHRPRSSAAGGTEQSPEAQEEEQPRSRGRRRPSSRRRWWERGN